MPLSVWVLTLIFGALCLGGAVAIAREKTRHVDIVDDEAGQDNESGLEEPDLDVEWAATQLSYLAAWNSLQGLPARLDLFAAASDRLALQCRRAGLDDASPPYVIKSSENDPAYHLLPAELGADAARPGYREAWQPLDRALNRLAAIQDLDDAVVHADAHEQVSIAARELADQLSEAPIPVDLAHCWFCQRGSSEVTQLLASDHACICEHCVQACVEHLYDR